MTPTEIALMTQVAKLEREKAALLATVAELQQAIHAIKLPRLERAS